jgi:SAM-dependent methyltransferase
MGLIDMEDLISIGVCPRCRSTLVYNKSHYICSNSACVYSKTLNFPVVGTHPVFVDFEHSILERNEIIRTLGASPILRKKSNPLKRKIRRIILGSNVVAKENAARFQELLKNVRDNPVVLVVGGATIGSGADLLYEDPSIQLISFDIYASPFTQFIADAHRIPLADQTVDGVWIQAVLEHVLDPWQVVSEIHRVLKKDGIVYAETPFMQQVHEGPYDFTRFTESGHRWLFKKFELIDSGLVAGPGTQLSWAIDHVTRSIFRSARAGLIVKILFFWVRYIDKISSTKYSLDSASCVFFLGRKAEREITPKEIVKHYRGAQVTYE